MNRWKKYKKRWESILSLFLLHQKRGNIAGKAKIGAVIALDGEKEFKSAVTIVNKELSSLKAESSLVTEKYEGQANFLEALKAKSEVLTKTLDKQKEKYAESTGATADAMEDMKEDIPVPSDISVLDITKGTFAEEGETIVSLVDIEYEDFERFMVELIVGLYFTIYNPMKNNVQAMTKLTTTINVLNEKLIHVESKNTESHRRIWKEKDKQSDY